MQTCQQAGAPGYHFKSFFFFKETKNTRQHPRGQLKGFSSEEILANLFKDLV